MSKFLVRFLSTFFYVGYFPLIPGTAASLIAVLLFFLLKDNLAVYILSLTALLILGFGVSGRAEELMHKKDPPCVVIDEVCGMLLGLLFVPYDLRLVIIGFFIFRILDTFKPYPIGRLERLRAGIGIMADDIIAGLYTSIILQVVARLTVFKGS